MLGDVDVEGLEAPVWELKTDLNLYTAEGCLNSSLVRESFVDVDADADDLRLLLLLSDKGGGDEAARFTDDVGELGRVTYSLPEYLEL